MYCFFSLVLTCVYSLYGLFLFKPKTAYEMRISDWSSDVCSSDLPVPWRHGARGRPGRGTGRMGRVEPVPGVRRPRGRAVAALRRGGGGRRLARSDRKSVVSGKSVSVRVELGGRGILKKKKKGERTV